jgi:hypothetical protein
MHARAMSMISAQQNWVSIFDQIPSICPEVFADISLETHTRQGGQISDEITYINVQLDG